MVSLTKIEKQKLKEILAKSESKEAKNILNKLSKEKKLKYVYNKKGIKTLLKKAYREKKKVKIRYYSLSSGEVKWRKVAIYQFDPDFIIAFCYLRNEERTFVNNRISQATILDESYSIPRDWVSESRVWSK
ncbi:MAG: WYL domain-containing protein [Nanoarchaeota archaeon]|nr:WYL domain-containing protein [Nanoarchaeota archaeon]